MIFGYRTDVVLIIRKGSKVFISKRAADTTSELDLRDSLIYSLVVLLVVQIIIRTNLKDAFRSIRWGRMFNTALSHSMVQGLFFLTPN